VDEIWHDLRFAGRSLARHPGMAAVAIITLALGIGANTAIFSVVNAVLLRPLPYPAADRLVQVWETDRERGGDGPVSPANYLDVRESSRTLDDVAAYGYSSFIVTGGAQPQRLVGAEVTPSFFDVLGAAPAMGRDFVAESGAGANAVVISDALWRSRFAADPAVLGQTIALSGRTYTVTGVMPPGFAYPQAIDLWATMPVDLSTIDRGRHYLYAVARIAEGSSLEQARADVSAIAERLATDYPGTNSNVLVKLVPLHEQIVGDARTPLIALLVAVGFVLLIACTNVVNVLLTRATGRTREVAVRRALGADSRRLARQFLTEGVLLTACGGAAGLLLAVWGTDVLVTLTAASVPRSTETRLDATVFLAALGALALVALGLGGAQAMALARTRHAGNLRDRTSSGGARGARIRAALAVVQLGLALPLLAGVALLLQTLGALDRVPTGFDPDGLLTMNVSLPAAKYDEGGQRTFGINVLERVRAVPGVVEAGLTSDLPFAGSRSTSSFSIAGRPQPDGPGPSADSRQVSAGYFRAMGMNVVRGRGIEQTDDEGAGRVVVINQTLARTWFEGQDPIGEWLRLGGAGGPPVPHQIVGVVDDIRHDNLRASPEPEFYTSLPQHPLSRLFLAVRAQGDALALADGIRQAIREVDADQPAWSVTTMRQRLDLAIAPQRSTMLLLAVFAVVATALAIVGLYGVIAFGVAQRARELGIRMALGALATDITGLVLRQAAVIVAAGVAIGLLASAALGGVMGGLLFEIEPADPATLAGVTALLAIAAVIACVVPARRATRVDPAITLRADAG
jgi:putative ABC transport system permease protein